MRDTFAQFGIIVIIVTQARARARAQEDYPVINIRGNNRHLVKNSCANISPRRGLIFARQRTRGEFRARARAEESSHQERALRWLSRDRAPFP